MPRSIGFRDHDLYLIIQRSESGQLSCRIPKHGDPVAPEIGLLTTVAMPSHLQVIRFARERRQGQKWSRSLSTRDLEIQPMQDDAQVKRKRQARTMCNHKRNTTVALRGGFSSRISSYIHTCSAPLAQSRN